MNPVSPSSSNSSSPRIFISALDWGLGHTTRCIPIIKTFLALGCTVFIGAEKAGLSLLKKEFPSANFIIFKGYGIRYSRKKEGFYAKIILQMPRIITVFYQEKRRLRQIISDLKIDAVISDNRFGLYSDKVPSVYITHQIRILTGWRFTDKIATRIHARIMSRFSKIWIPDFKNDGLAGILSHPAKIPRHATYLGAISRFEKDAGLATDESVLILLSGPEPQRSILEQIILHQAESVLKPLILVRGLPHAKNSIAPTNPNMTVYNHLPAEDLSVLIQKAAFIICRSGYTTIMDLVKLNKKAILIPTPGQAEQEYLASYLMEKNYFYSVQQDSFDLTIALKNLDHFEFAEIQAQQETYQETVEEFVASLK